MENGLKKRYILLRSIVTVFLALCIFNLIAGLTFTGLSLSVPSEVYEAAEITKPSDITKTVIQCYPESVQPIIKAIGRIAIWINPSYHVSFSAKNIPSNPKVVFQLVLWSNLSIACLSGVIWWQLRKLFSKMTSAEPPLPAEKIKALRCVSILLMIIATVPYTLETFLYNWFFGSFADIAFIDLGNIGSSGFSVIGNFPSLILLIIGICLFENSRKIYD